MRIQLDHVQLAAPPGCELEARRFFGGLIGLRELEKPKSLRDRGSVWFAVATSSSISVSRRNLRPLARATQRFTA